MGRQLFSISPVRDLGLEALDAMIRELNTQLQDIGDALDRLEGQNGHTPTYANDVDFGGKRAKNAGRSVESTDFVTRGELEDLGLFAGSVDTVLRLRNPLSADRGLDVPRALSGPNAVPLDQINQLVGVALDSILWNEIPTGAYPGTSFTLAFTPKGNAILAVHNGLVLKKVAAGPSGNEFLLSGATLSTGLTVQASGDLWVYYQKS